MKSKKNVEKQLINMNMTPTPDRDRQILESALQAQVDAQKNNLSSLQPEPWRYFIRYSILKYIAAGIIIIGSLYLLTFIDRIPFCERYLHDRVTNQYQAKMR